MDLPYALNPLEHASVTPSDRGTAVTILHEVMLRVDSDLYTQSSMATACVIWSGLERKYKSEDLFRFTQLAREFHSMRQGDNEPPVAWIVRMDTLKCQLLALGGEPPDRSHKNRAD